jgi:hypothetical protein
MPISYLAIDSYELFVPLLLIFMKVYLAFPFHSKRLPWKIRNVLNKYIDDLTKIKLQLSADDPVDSQQISCFSQCVFHNNRFFMPWSSLSFTLETPDVARDALNLETWLISQIQAVFKIGFLT